MNPLDLAKRLTLQDDLVARGKQTWFTCKKRPFGDVTDAEINAYWRGWTWSFRSTQENLFERALTPSDAGATIGAMRTATPRYIATAILLVITTAVLAAQNATLKPIPYTDDGGIPLPDYSKWIYIGSGLFNIGQSGQSPTFSNVFVEPAAYDQYMKTGVWPDRTVIFSEKRAAITTVPITSSAGWAQTGELLGAELEIKDAAKGGWKYYEAAKGQKAGRPVADQAACNSCHAQQAAVDNVFVQFYPTLTGAARRHGTYRGSTK